jgi:hypothetical protein
MVLKLERTTYKKIQTWRRLNRPPVTLKTSNGTTRTNGSTTTCKARLDGFMWLELAARLSTFAEAALDLRRFEAQPKKYYGPLEAD